MKYFNPSYWFKLWVLSAPLFNDKTQGINAMLIDNNQKTKDLTNKNVTSLSNNQRDLDLQTWKKDWKRIKRNITKDINNDLQNQIENISTSDYLEFNNKNIIKIGEEINNFVADSNDNIYFGIKNELFLLKSNETNATKITEVLNDIILLEIDNKDNVYIGTDNGIYKLSAGSNTPIKIDSIDDNIKSLTIDSQGNIYILTDKTDNNLYVLKPSQKTKVSYAIQNVKSLLIDKSDNVYIGTDNGIYKSTDDGEQGTRKISNVDINGDIHLIISDNNNIYFAIGAKFFGNNDLYIIKNNEAQANKINFTFGFITSLVADNDNNLYIGTNNGLFLLKKEELTPTKIKKLNHFIYYLSIDKYNNIYVGSDLGIYSLKEQKINKLFDKNSENYFDNFVKVTKNNNVFIKINRILYYLNNINLVKFKKIEGEGAPDAGITLIDIDSKDNIYFGTNYQRPYFFRKNEMRAHVVKGIIDNKLVSLLVDKEDNVYFGTFNGLFLLKSNEEIAERIDLTIGSVYNIFYKDKDNVYFGTNNGIYKLNSNKKSLILIKEIFFVKDLVVDSKDNIYFATNNGFFVLKQGIINEKINEFSKINLFFQDHIQLIGIDNKDNVYIGTDNGIYKLSAGSNTPIKIEGLSNGQKSIVVHKNDDLYIGLRDIGLYVLKSGETTATKISNISAETIKFDSKNNLYIANYDGLFILEYGENNIKKITGVDKWINNFFINKNDNVVFIDRRTNNFGFLQNKLDFDSIIEIINLKQIINNNDETILNTLNFLNRESNYFLNLNKIKVYNKTTTSAIIEAIKGKYRGEVTVNYKIKNKDEISNIYLTDVLKKAGYFDFIDRKFYSFDKIKNIQDINIEKLNFWNVEVTRNSELTRIINFKDICKKEKINKSSIIKTLKIPKCEYNSTSKLEFQITKGLSKTNQENKISGSNINIEDENKLIDFVQLKYQKSEIELELSDKFDISNLNKQEQVTILDTFKEEEEELQIAPKERVDFSYQISENKWENSLNLKQKITGTFSAKIINDKNEEEKIEMPIKKAMSTLQKYSLLPDEFDINEDDSITFNGKAKISSIREKKPEKSENYFSI